MLAASLPVQQTTTNMGLSQQNDNNLDLPDSAQGVYFTFSASTIRNGSYDSDDTTTLSSSSSSSSPSLDSSPENPLISVSEGAQKAGHNSNVGDSFLEDLGAPTSARCQNDRGIPTEKEDTNTVTITFVQDNLEDDSAGSKTSAVPVSAKPKYGSTIVGLPKKFTKKVKALEKKKEKQRKKKWRPVDAEDMGFKLTLFPREPVKCDVNRLEEELVVFDAVLEAELDCEDEQTKPYRHLLQLEGKGLRKEGKYVRRDSDRRVQKAHKQVKSKDVASVSNNRGRKMLYIHFRLYKRNPFLQCQNLAHPNLPSPRRKEGVCMDVAKSVINATLRVPPRAPHHRPQNLHHALDNRNAASELPTDLVSFLISIQHREMTPEDYDMLLRLDEGVAPKTVSENVIAEFKTDIVDESTAGGVCSVCMEAYEVGQSRKFLPCEHVFHVQCIDTWLANSSQNCPLDGLPVAPS